MKCIYCDSPGTHECKRVDGYICSYHAKPCCTLIKSSEPIYKFVKGQGWLPFLLILLLLGCTKSPTRPVSLSNHKPPDPPVQVPYRGNWGGWEYWQAQCHPRTWICQVTRGGSFCYCVP